MKCKLVAALFFTLILSPLFGMETYPVWPSTPPGDQPEQYKENGGSYDTPTLEWWRPENQTSKACLMICCGGSYQGVAYEYEGVMPRDYFLAHGVTVVMLRYRTPRRPNVTKHLPAWQDLQRTIRFVRSNAEAWGIDPEKIGAMGFSAGGHLVLMGATTSQTASYEKQDALDDLPCHLNFAVPIYPAYVLTDGVDGANAQGGNDAPLVEDFAFDAKTPPMCFIHGDGDDIASMGSVAVYRQLRKMGIPGEVHIFALANHAWRNCAPDAAVRRYPDRVLDWMNEMKIY